MTNISLAEDGPARLIVSSEPLQGTGCAELFEGYDGVLELVNKTHATRKHLVESLGLELVRCRVYHDTYIYVMLIDP